MPRSLYDGKCIVKKARTIKSKKRPRKDKELIIDQLKQIAEGLGALVIIDVDPSAAAAITGVAASSDGIHNVKMMRLFSHDEIVAIRTKAKQIQGSYKTPGK